MHLSRKQSVVGSNTTRVALFSFYVKKKVLGLLLKDFFMHILNLELDVFGGLITPVHSFMLSSSSPVYQVWLLTSPSV